MCSHATGRDAISEREPGESRRIAAGSGTMGRMADGCVPMGPTQRLVHFMDRVAPVNFVLHADVRGPFEPARLAEAFDAAQREHPFLRVRVERAGGIARPQLLFCEGGVGRAAVREIAGGAPGEAELAREIERELSERFADERGPLVRAAWGAVEGGRTRLLLTMHHAIADGASAAILLRDLLARCGAPESSPVRDAPLAPGGPRFPALAATRRFADLAGFFARMGWHWIGRRPAGANVPGLNAPAAGRATAVLMRELDAGQTAAVVAAAKREGATVGGLLSAALVRAVHRASGAGRPAYVSLLNAVDVRPTEGAEAAGRVDLLMSFVVTHHLAGDGRDVFELARDCSRSVRRAVERRDPAVPHTLAGLLPSYEPVEAARAAARVADRFATSASMTNVGRIEMPERFGALELERVRFAPSLGFMGRFAGVASTFAGRLSWNFVYVRQVVGDDLARRLADRSVAELLSAAAPTRNRER